MKRLMTMNFRIILLIVIAIGLTSNSAFAQKNRKRPPKQENVQTRANADDKKEEQRNAMEEAYKDKVKKHQSIQDKGTKKRMKKSHRRAELHSQGREIPFYKRWFHRKKI